MVHDSENWLDEEEEYDGCSELGVCVVEELFANLSASLVQLVRFKG